MTLTVTDQTEVSRHVTKTVNVSAGAPPGTLSVAVFRQAGWSHDVKLLARAHEQSCEGAQVATAEATASLAKDGITPVELLLGAMDADGDGFVRREDQGTDCDDTDPARKGPTPWYADDDGDGYGNGLLPPRTVACEGPALTASRAGDCNDRDLNVHPDQAEFRCDGQDDNCDGVKDESFDVGGTCVNALDCQGVKACDGAGAVACTSTATPPVYYVDTDGDGRAGTEVRGRCGPIPEGASPQSTDCDESSRFRASGLTEVCDRIDNDCSGGADNGLACNLDWRTPVVTDGTNWKATATDGTANLWVAGDGGKLALSQMDFTGDRLIPCDGDWKAAWVAASGELFLAGGKGTAGRFARVTPSATECTTETHNIPQVMNGLVGIENPSGPPTLYGVTGGGRSFRWTPPAAPEQTQPNAVAASLRAISAAGRLDTLLAVGSRNASTPVAFRFDVASSTWSEEALPAALTGELRGVHVVNASYAYAVGDNGMALERVNGVWSAMKPVPAAYSTRSLQDVVAFGRTAVYVATTDAGANGGSVLFFNGSDWSVVYTDVNAPARALRSLDGKTPTGVVATGDRGAAASFVTTR
ncbi:putative metal-binding motif-containing protein [Corallococcus coralloides]|uniref:putative metal-binding motif-containing protein n=1 Tax=Corallococcus coralloides TaxID=184914 RepID=UPI00384FA7A1